MLYCSRIKNFRRRSTIFPSLPTNRSIFHQIMASKDDSTSSKSVQSSKFAFRPSKLTSVTEKIWKKDLATEISKKPEESVLKLVEKPIFTSSTTSTTEISTSGSSKNFIFGQNIRDRVVMQKEEEKQQSTSSGADFKDFKDIKKDPDAKNGDSKNLEESAKSYEQSKLLATKVKLSENLDLKTGEEDDQNILQVNCKLHIFDHEKKTWEERGGALFRLNEISDDANYRIVIRLTGNLRLVVNSRLFSGMLLEKISAKRLKFSVVDFEKDNQVQICLVTANQIDIDRIENLIRFKLSDMKSPPKRKIDNDDEEKATDKKLKA